MEKYDVIIIGSGLGGLECGFILAKNGLKVCLLEQDANVGGCLRTFRRGKTIFDTGFHYVGGLDEGQPLNRLFRYFGLLDLPWQKMDENAFDEVVIGDRSFFWANGYERFVDTLAQYFPHQRTNLISYTSFLKNVGDHLFDSFQVSKDDIYTTSLFARSAHEFLCETIDDPLLRSVLSGTSLKMELNAAKLPLYVFAQINNSFIQSAWKLKGGGMQIAEKLAEQIRSMGGEVYTGTKVTRMIEKNGVLSTIEVNGSEQFSASWVISNAHPAYTLSLVDETKILRKIYRKRIASLENTFGMFTANICLKPEKISYQNRNIYVHRKDADLWNARATDPLSSVMVYYPVPDDDNAYVRSIDLLTPMKWDEIEKWVNTPPGRRGEDYVAMKNQKASECIEFVSRHIPELQNNIERIFTSTPLSYQSYTNTVDGSAYGILKDYNNPMYTVLTPRTPIPNLLLTGQNLNLHGILGVSITSFFTCAEILGMELLKTQLMES